MPKTVSDDTQLSDFKAEQFQLAALNDAAAEAQRFDFRSRAFARRSDTNMFSLNAIWIAFFCDNAAALILFGTGFDLPTTS